MRRVLMVSFQFPPMAATSGIQRALRFVQYLPEFSWEPLVLTADPRAYEHTGADLLAEIPERVVVRRAFALDSARHLAVGGRYWGALARPDRWISWRFDAVRQGLQLIRQFRPAALWSSFPIATTHLIGAELQRRSGLPWIADFRDPMAQQGYPADPRIWRDFQRIEALALARARFSTFTTPGAAEDYRRRYPEAGERITILENGYDEESFGELLPEETGPLLPGTPVLLHSGIIYPEERDPRQLFAALRQLVDSGRLSRDGLRVRFRAAMHDQLLRQLAREYGVDDMIELCPPIPYREALKEMQRADALLVVQAANCNAQIPAKIYEYLRAGRPILALTDPAGDTAGVVRRASLATIARLDSADDIASTIGRLLEDLHAGRAATPDPAMVASASRRGRTESLAELLERACRE